MASTVSSGALKFGQSERKVTRADFLAFPLEVTAFLGLVLMSG
jgi:hypothetical protein